MLQKFRQANQFRPEQQEFLEKKLIDLARNGSGTSSIAALRFLSILESSSKEVLAAFIETFESPQYLSHLLQNEGKTFHQILHSFIKNGQIGPEQQKLIERKIISLARTIEDPSGAVVLRYLAKYGSNSTEVLEFLFKELEQSTQGIVEKAVARDRLLQLNSLSTILANSDLRARLITISEIDFVKISLLEALSMADFSRYPEIVNLVADLASELLFTEFHASLSLSSTTLGNIQEILKKCPKEDTRDRIVAEMFHVFHKERATIPPRLFSLLNEVNSTSALPLSPELKTAVQAYFSQPNSNERDKFLWLEKRLLGDRPGISDIYFDLLEQETDPSRRQIFARGITRAGNLSPSRIEILHRYLDSHDTELSALARQLASNPSNELPSPPDLANCALDFSKLGQ